MDAELSLRYWSSHSNLFQFAVVPLQAYDNYQNAWIAEHELIAQWEAPLNLSTLSTPYDLPEPSSHRRYCKVLSLKTMKGEEGGCVAAVAMKRPAGRPSLLRLLDRAELPVLVV